MKFVSVQYICTLIPICLQTVWYLSLNDTAFEVYSFSFLVHSWNISHKLLSMHEPSTKMYHKKYLNNHPMSNTQYSTDQNQVFGDTINFSWTKMLSSWTLQSSWKLIFFCLDYPFLKKNHIIITNIITVLSVNIIILTDTFNLQ